MIQKINPIIQSISTRYHLTKRESEILTLIAAFGYKNQEIAKQCFISEKTVKVHINNLMGKFEVGSMRKLISLLIQQSLIEHR